MNLASGSRYTPRGLGGAQTSDLVMSLKNQTGELSLGPDVSNMKIPDSMIKCLPAFGYTQIERETFLKAFARMLRSNGLTRYWYSVCTGLAWYQRNMSWTTR